MSSRSDKAARLSDFVQRLLDEWRRHGWQRECARFILAVSGGADSVALLLAFDELHRAKRLSGQAFAVAHLDHGLRGARGADDAHWVAELARTLRYECVLGRAPVKEHAHGRRDNLEQAARRARYDFLGATARRHGASAIVTAHTLDDQAETVLLRLLRGSGAEGLGGMRPARSLDAKGDVLLLRPLLGWARRADTVGFCRARGVEFRHDEMNEDERFARVRLRRKVLPLLETLNPRAAEAIGRASELLREDAAALDLLASGLFEEASVAREKMDGAKMRGADEADARKDAHEMDADERHSVPPPLRVEILADAPAALRRRALRKWIACGRGDLRRLELSHVIAVEKLLKGTRGGRIAELPGGCFIERRQALLHFRRKLS